MENMELDFQKIVPVLLDTGMIYIRTLTVRDELNLSKLDFTARTLERFRKQVCNEKGEPFLTVTEVARLDYPTYELISECIEELNASVKKNRCPTLNDTLLKLRPQQEETTKKY